MLFTQKLLFFRIALAVSFIFFTINLFAQFESRRSYGDNGSLIQSDSDYNKTSTNPIYLRFEHRLILAYLLESIGLSESSKLKLSQRMEKSLGLISQRGVEWVKVKTFKEYLSLQKSDWPNSHRLSFDLRVLEKKIEDDIKFKIKFFYSENAEVQKEIIAHNFAATQSFLNLLNKNKIPISRGMYDFALKSIKTIINNINQFPKSVGDFLDFSLTSIRNLNIDNLSLEKIGSIRESIASTVSQGLILQSFSASESLLNSFMREIEPVINSVLKKLESVDLPSGEKRALEIIFKGYFKELSLESKKLMLNALLELPVNSTLLEKFQTMVQLADPVFQKCMQLFARAKNMPPEISKIFQTLESSVRPVPWFLVKSIIEPELSKYSIISISETPLGVGTQRQYHLGKLKLENGEIVDVVIGILKPDSERRVNEGETIMKELAPRVDNDHNVQKSDLPRLEAFIDDSMRFIRLEQNSDHVRGMQSKFNLAYQHSDNEIFKNYGIVLEFSAPKIYEPRGGTSNIIVQEFVLGDKMDLAIEKSKVNIPDIKKILAEQLFILWFRELIFGSGLYHGDLHHGNMKVLINEVSVKFSIIDFGMSGQISLNGRSQLIKLGASVELLDAKTMSSIFWDMRDPALTSVSKDSLLKAINDKIRAEGSTVSREMDEWIKFTSKIGLMLKGEFVDMVRGFVTVKNLINEVQSDINSNEEAKKLALKFPIKSAMITLLGSIQTRSPNFWSMSELIFETYQKTRLESESMRQVDNFLKEKSRSSTVFQCKMLFQM